MELFEDKWGEEKRYCNYICQKYSISEEKIRRYYFNFKNWKLFNEFQELIFKRCIHTTNMPKLI